MTALAEERTEAPLRKIIHVDMDAFYAPVEQRDDASPCGKPIFVGAPRHYGIVATAGYEARAFGVKAGVLAPEAVKRCSGIISVKPPPEVSTTIPSSTTMDQ